MTTLEYLEKLAAEIPNPQGFSISARDIAKCAESVWCLNQDIKDSLNAHVVDYCRRRDRIAASLLHSQLNNVTTWIQDAVTLEQFNDSKIDQKDVIHAGFHSLLKMCNDGSENGEKWVTQTENSVKQAVVSQISNSLGYQKRGISFKELPSHSLSQQLDDRNSPDPATLLSISETKQLVKRVLDRLPLDQRNAIERRFSRSSSLRSQPVPITSLDKAFRSFRREMRAMGIVSKNGHVEDIPEMTRPAHAAMPNRLISQCKEK